MITEKQKNAIKELISISAAARSITDRIDPQIGMQTDVETLRSHLARVEELVGTLSDQLEEALHPQAVFDDVQADEFQEVFGKSVQQTPYRIVVSQYGVDYLRAYPRNVRVLICTVLLNVFKQRKLTPLPVWDSIVASNGIIS